MNKKITFLASLFVASSALAQKINAPEKMAQGLNTENTKVVAATPAKALGTPIWTSDFSTPADWVINNDGQTGPTFGWNINATKEGWANSTTAGIINSTSGGNFAELGNGNPTLSPGTQALDVDYYLTSANPITIATSNLSLSFVQNGALFNDLQEFQISVNGTTWITVGNNSNKGTLSQSGGAPYPNPDLVNINLSSYIPGGSTQLWVRFHWTTRFPASATNPNVWITYGWHIDDVAISTLPDYDMEITNEYWGSEGLNYYQIPTTQIAPIDFSLNVRSNGGMNMTNVQYGVAITGAGTFNGTSTPGTLVSNDVNDSLYLTTQFTPAAVGTYNVTRTLTSTEVDDVPTNNALTNYSFNVTNHVYARDNNVANGFTTNGTDPFETGNLFDIWADQVVKGVDIRLATGTPTGASAIDFYVRIYKIENGDFVYVTESDQITTTPAMVNANYTVYLGAPLQLTANTTYLVMVGSYSGGLRVVNAGSSYDQTSFLLDGNDIDLSTLYYQNETPLIRLNFDPALGVEELTTASNLNVYPNPFAGTTEVSFELKADANVSAVVTDLSGRTVATVPASMLNAGAQTITIDGTSFQAGIYNVTLTVGNETITKRIVKK